jgi:predicted secreted protein
MSPSPHVSSAAASADATGGATFRAEPTGDSVVRVEDDGRTLDVSSGSTVTFKLAASGGTGYVWMPSGVDSTILAPQGDRTSEVPSDVPGAPKMDVYRFTAQHAGTTAVEMDLQRPWTKSAPPAKSIHVVVTVH